MSAQVDKAREILDAATIDRIHGEPAANESALELASNEVRDMNIDQLHEWVDFGDFFKSLPTKLQEPLLREYRAQVALVISEQ